jgi:hypothetical protein
MEGRREATAESDTLDGMAVTQGARRVVVNWQVKPRSAQWNEFWRHYFNSIAGAFDGQHSAGGDE